MDWDNKWEDQKTFIKNIDNILFIFVLEIIDYYDSVVLTMAIYFYFYFISSLYVFGDFIIFESPFYDIGTLISLLICLEHLYVSYYLVIVTVLVYWCLFIFIKDFLSWSSLIRPHWFINLIRHWLFEGYLGYFVFSLFKFYLDFIKLLIFFKELECIFFLKYAHINFGRDSSIPLKISCLIPFLLRKRYINRINLVNLYLNFFKYYDVLGRSILILNYGSLKVVFLLSLLQESIYTIKRHFNYEENSYKNKLSFKLYYFNKPIFLSSVFYYKFLARSLDRQQLHYNHNLKYTQTLYMNYLKFNSFKHSGLFEAVWAIFPTIIIVSILIPSLVLLYSFEDILNPKITIKAIGNQWYWTYEFDNWIPYKGDSLEKQKYISYSFNSNIVLENDLNFGSKRLLEVDNRLVLPTNITIRLLVGSTDVLHSYAVPELGFKVDAVPGRLNQILLYISRPGVYYGQCSELCGINHGFMPIVIHAITPNNFTSYLDKLKDYNNSIELKEVIIDNSKDNSKNN